MQTFLHGRDLLGDLDFSREEVETVLDVAFDLKRKRALNEPHAYLRDKTLAMLFFFSSTRTRGSFEAGMAQLGGHAAFIESRTTQIAHGDTAKEIGEILGRYYDGMAIRHVDWGVGNQYINEVARYSRTPVLNMQCEIYHPFQILADLMTVIEKKGRDLRRKKMVVSWAYAASYQKPMSVPQSLILQMPRFGLDVVLAHPPEFRLMPDIMDQAREQARKFGTGFEVVDDMDEA
ncbi:MAG: ornithine carbamoyltransferase, partial [Anaerolineaceae bacterium]